MSDQTETTPTEVPTPAAPPTVTIGGKGYPLAPLGLPEIGELRAFTKRIQPDPLEAMKPYLDDAAPGLQRMLIDNALAEVRRPVLFGSPEFMGAIQSREGLREILWLCLRRGGADVDPGVVGRRGRRDATWTGGRRAGRGVRATSDV